MVYNKTVLSYPGQLWPKHQPVHSSSNMLWKTRGQVSPFLRSERLKSILGCWRSQGGHSGGRTTLIASSSTSMSSRWGWSLIPKVGIVPGLLLNSLLYSGLTTHEYAGFSGFAFIFILYCRLSFNRRVSKEGSPVST